MPRNCLSWLCVCRSIVSAGSRSLGNELCESFPDLMGALSPLSEMAKNHEERMQPIETACALMQWSPQFRSVTTVAVHQIVLSESEARQQPI